MNAESLSVRRESCPNLCDGIVCRAGIADDALAHALGHGFDQPLDYARFILDDHVET